MTKKKKSEINLKPAMYLLFGLFLGSIWFTDKVEVFTLKLGVTVFTIICVGFFYDTFYGWSD